MTRLSFADQLEAASNGIDDLSRSDLQVLLRRAALRLRNEIQTAGTVVLDEDLADLFDRLAASADPPVSRDEMVSAALADWAIEQGYIEADDLDEDSETEGNA